VLAEGPHVQAEALLQQNSFGYLGDDHLHEEGKMIFELWLQVQKLDWKPG
jgi:hypothetical protein